MKSKRYGVLEPSLCWTTARKGHRMYNKKNGEVLVFV